VRQLLLLLVIALGACAPRIQADDPEAFQQTAEAAMADMDAGTRRQFIQAIYSIREGSTKELSEAELADPETWRDHNAQLAEWVDGRSADEVIQRGYEARLRLLRERLRDADSRLQQSRDLTRPHVARMAAVRVEGARFYQSGNALREMAVSFRLTNGTDQPLRRVRFRGLVSSRGRTLVDDTISYDLEEPLAPGESRDFDLVTSFGAFADRGLAREPDLALSLRIVNLGGSGADDYLVPPYLEDPAWIERQNAVDRVLLGRLQAEYDAL
jgi:hypothetical protein